MRALVVDDEALARRRLIRMLGRLGGISVCGEAKDGHEAREMVDRYLPDVLFLDIRMPGLDGMQLALQGGLPPIVFTTAYDEHAVSAFDANAVDYLLKPVTAERLQVAVDKLRALGNRPVRLRVQVGNVIRVFDARDVTRFWADEKYSRFCVDGADHLLDDSLNTLQERLEGIGFFRSHRGELIRLTSVQRLERSAEGHVAVLEDGQRARISRRSLTALRSALEE